MRYFVDGYSADGECICIAEVRAKTARSARALAGRRMASMQKWLTESGEPVVRVVAERDSARRWFRIWRQRLRPLAVTLNVRGTYVRR